MPLRLKMFHSRVNRVKNHRGRVLWVLLNPKMGGFTFLKGPPRVGLKVIWQLTNACNGCPQSDRWTLANASLGYAVDTDKVESIAVLPCSSAFNQSWLGCFSIAMLWWIAHWNKIFAPTTCWSLFLLVVPVQLMRVYLCTIFMTDSANTCLLLKCTQRESDSFVTLHAWSVANSFCSWIRFAFCIRHGIFLRGPCAGHFSDGEIYLCVTSPYKWFR